MIKRPSKWWAILIGSGLAIEPIHNTWLTGLTTNSRGEVLLFLPALGFLMVIMGSGLLLFNYWDRSKEIGWGDRRIVIPLLIIAAAISLSGITADGLQAKVAPLGMAISMLALYQAARMLGRDIFLPVAAGAAVAALGVIVRQVIFPGHTTGGFIFEANYDIATGYILLGASLFIHKYQWLLAGLALTAILMSGSPESVLVVVVIGTCILLFRDVGRKLAYAAIPLAIGLLFLAIPGHFQDLYGYTSKIATGEKTVHAVLPDGTEVHESALGFRLLIIKRELSNLTPLGDGYNVTGFTPDFVHNVPLIIVQQLGYPGIIAGIAWLWVAIYLLIRSKWKYAWILVLVLSVWDHFTWTQIGPWYWALAGVSSLGDLNTHLVFRR